MKFVKVRKVRKVRKDKKKKKKIKNTNNQNKTQTRLCICDTICPKMDDDNRFNGLVLPLAHGWTIWYFSYLHLFTSYYAFYNQYYVLCFFGLGSLGTSLNYWKYPLHDSWRRYFDIAFIQLTFYVHMYYAFLISSGYGYMFFTGTGIICYGISNSYTKKKYLFRNLLPYFSAYICIYWECSFVFRNFTIKNRKKITSLKYLYLNNIT